MKAALILLVCAAFFFTFKVTKSTTAHFTINNVSKINSTADIQVFVDRKLVFRREMQYKYGRHSKAEFNLKLRKGKHYIQVRSNGDDLVHYQEFDINRRARVNVNYSASYQLDPISKKPKGDGSMSKELTLEVID